MNYWQGIVILSGIAAFFVLWPLVRYVLVPPRRTARNRDDANTFFFREHLAELQQALANGDISDEEFTALKRDQERALLEDAATADNRPPPRHGGVVLIAALAVLIPLLSWGMYVQLGNKADWDIQQMVQVWQQGGAGSEAMQTRLRHKLVQRLQNRPDNTRNWYLLASLALDAGDFDQAVAAYRAILQRQPDSPQIMAELAQALFLQSGNTVTPQVRDYTRRALELAPDMPTALGLAGIDAFQQEQFQMAIDYWAAAVERLGENSPGARSLLSGIARAKSEMEARGETPESGGGDVAPPPASEESIQVEVTLAEDVEVDPQATVFIYARAWRGPRMPLAIQRFTAGDLPATVTLNDSMAMAEGMNLSAFEELEVVARVSESGQAVPQSGDWQATAGPVQAEQNGPTVSLVIREQIP